MRRRVRINITDLCTIRETRYKGGRDNNERHQLLNQHLYSMMIYSTLSANEIRDCLDYEYRLQAAQLRVGAPLMDPPLKWNEFQSEQMALNSWNQTNYPPYQCQHLLITNNVSMPADTLEAIIQAIRNVSHPAPPTAPRVVTKYVLHPQPTPMPVVHRGRGGGAGGRG